MRWHIRFSLRSILFVIAIVAMGLFWIRWPSMTASSFVANPNIDPKLVILDFDTLEEQMKRMAGFSVDNRNATAQLVAFERSFIDVLTGVQHFDYGMYDITARRGKVAVYGPYYNFGFGKMRR